jgi:hypothetical protein
MRRTAGRVRRDGCGDVLRGKARIRHVLLLSTNSNSQEEAFVPVASWGWAGRRAEPAKSRQCTRFGRAFALGGLGGGGGWKGWYGAAIIDGRIARAGIGVLREGCVGDPPGFL